MWNYSKGEKAYKEWAAYRTKTETLRDDKGEVLRDAQGRPMRGETLDFGRKRAYTDSYGETRTVTEPTFWENVHFFFNYQLSYMYWRYFMWNFVGRQSDIQPSRTTITDGNWLSGIRWIDEKYVGPQDNLPREIAENKGRNTYYFLPFLLGLIGLVYQLNRDQRNFSIVLWLFVMMGIALVFYFNTSPGEPRERDYVYAGSFYAFSIWIGFGVLALRDLIARLSKRDNVATAAAATVVAMSVPAILAAQNWDDHDRSHRTMARDIGWNYLQSTLPNSIILNYGDNDTFPLWNNQEVYGVRPDVRIMNTSYLGGEWYIDEMKTKANDAPGVPFSLPKHKYTFNNDMIYVTNSIDRPVEIKEVIDFVRSDDPRSKVKLADGTLADYIPAKRIALPVNKENALASGIVAEKDRDKMVDTVFINIKKNSLDKNQLMILDMLANFDWKRPIYMTQVYILQDFGLMDYLQFDGYAYRLVPILTPTQNPYEIGRIDADYAAPLLRDTFRYGNLKDPRVYADYFIQYNLSASHARDAFARVAKELLRQNRVAEAVELLDLGLERMPTSQVRFTDTNTYPFLEAYYAASAMGDKEAAAKGRRPLEGVCPDADRIHRALPPFRRGAGRHGLGPYRREARPAGRHLLPGQLRRPQGGGGRTERLLPFAGGLRGEPDRRGRQTPAARLGAAARREITGTGNEITHVTLLLRALFLCCRPHPERISGRPKSGSAVKTDIFEPEHSQLPSPFTIFAK